MSHGLSWGAPQYINCILVNLNNNCAHWNYNTNMRKPFSPIYKVWFVVRVWSIIESDNQKWFWLALEKNMFWFVVSKKNNKKTKKKKKNTSSKTQYCICSQSTLSFKRVCRDPVFRLVLSLSCFSLSERVLFPMFKIRSLRRSGGEISYDVIRPDLVQ